MSMSEPSGVVVPGLYDSSGGYVMSLQKGRVPELLMLAGAAIAEPWPVVVVVPDVEDDPPPQPARTPTNASTTRRDSEETLSFMEVLSGRPAAAADRSSSSGIPAATSACRREPAGGSRAGRAETRRGAGGLPSRAPLSAPLRFRGSARIRADARPHDRDSRRR